MIFVANRGIFIWLKVTQLPPWLILNTNALGEQHLSTVSFRANLLAGRPDTAMVLIKSALRTIRPEAASFNDLWNYVTLIQQHYLSGSSEDRMAFELFFSSEFLIRQKSFQNQQRHYITYGNNIPMPLSCHRQFLGKPSSAKP
jgi:hypothetical protein